jgi:peptidoglycan-associated lipoprotein
MNLRRCVWLTTIVLLVTLTVTACAKKIPPPPPPPPAPPAAPVSFDYDMSLIREDQRAILQKNADYMRRWTSIRVTIEGHADARGTNEYNLALGERRGNAVKDYLTGLGIAAERMVVISKGEESPLCTEETEGCFARNRRGHFIISAK